MKNNQTEDDVILKNCCEALVRFSYERAGLENRIREIKRMDAEDYLKMIIKK